MNRFVLVTATAAALAGALPAASSAQTAPEGLAALARLAGAAPAPAAPAAPAARRSVRTNPVVRSTAIMLGSAAGFHVGQTRQATEDADDLLVPIAAGVAGGALVGWVFSDAHPAKILAGSVLGTLPAGALAYYLAGTLDEDVQGRIPLVAFSVPHGLITSAFAQSPRR
jgi:hypothetical protein